mgnify:CR=1 FL=1
MVAPTSAITDVLYEINEPAKTFSFPEFTSSEANCVSEFKYTVKWKVSGVALATVASSSDYLYRSVQGTNDKDVMIYTSSSADVGTAVLTIECTNAFTGAGSPVTKDFNVVLSIDCSSDAIVAAT